MSATTEERAKLAIEEFGELLDSKEGRLECGRKYGIEVMMLAVDNFNFYKVDHPLPEGYAERVEKTKKSMPLCKSDTILRF